MRFEANTAQRGEAELRGFNPIASSDFFLIVSCRLVIVADCFVVCMVIFTVRFSSKIEMESLFCHKKRDVKFKTNGAHSTL